MIANIRYWYLTGTIDILVSFKHASFCKNRIFFSAQYSKINYLIDRRLLVQYVHVGKGTVNRFMSPITRNA
jgi:hypothetical protein